MSLRLRLKYHYRSVRGYVKFFSIPDWVDSKLFRLAILGSVITMAAMYVIGVSSASNGGFELRALETKISQLQSENKQLETDLAEASSLKSITSRLPEVAMTNPTKVTRLKPVVYKYVVAER